MKTTTLLLAICWACACNVFAQKMSKKEARLIFDKTTTYLKTSDTAAFVNLWLLDEKPQPGDRRPFNLQDVKENFKELQTFLDTALAQSMPIDYIDVEKLGAKSRASYKIKAWYKYNAKTKYYKAYGFLLDYVNNKWVFRFSPEYTWSTKS